MKKRIFFMNKGVGPTNSGVEHAEKYRYDILKKQGHYVKIILTEPGENVYKYSEDLGFERSDVISIYDYLLGASYKNPAQRQWHNMSTTWWNENGRVAVNNEEKNYFAKIDTEDYHDAYTSRADLALRFIQIFAEKENVTSDDVLIVDRGDIDAPAVLAAKLPWKIGFVVHAEHRSPDERDQAIGVMLWNNYYEFEFDHIDKYDYAITATETEKKQLEEDFAFNGNQNPAPIFAIPVGSVSKAVLDRKHVKVADREPHSLITVSRLAPEKHVDVIGNAIPLIKEKYPDVKLHVYGVGKHKEDLDKIIEEHSLQDNIILHGHSYELDEPYENAQIYLSASTSEGFGLTYLEAISHGTTIVGLNAPYGIQEMTDQGKVGTLIDYKRSDLKSASKKMAEEVIALFDNPEQLQKYSDESYARSLNYSSESIAKKYEEWLETL